MHVTDDIDPRLAALFAHQGISRSFLADAPMRRAAHNGVTGVTLTVRLTSYRALPLSCLEGISVTIDGCRFEGDDLALILDHVPYRPSAFATAHDRWWFVLDMAELFVPAGDIAGGAHEVEATLITVEPYMTAGRFPSYSPDRRRLSVAEA